MTDARGRRRPLLTLLTGSVAAQALVYGARPLLTRLYTPEEVGLAGVFAALVAVLALPATGRYDEAALLADDERDGPPLLKLGAALSVGLAAALLVAVPWRAAVAGALGQPALAPFVALVPLAVLLAGLSRTAESALLRARAFGRVAGRRVAASVASVAVQLGAGVAGAGAGGVAAGPLAGQGAALGLYARALWRVARAPAPAEGFGALARRHARFPLYALPTGLLNTFAVQLPFFALLRLFDAAAVGHYGTAYGLLVAPIALVGGASGQAFAADAADARRTGRLADESEALFARLVGAGAFPLLGLCVAGPDVYATLLGAAWREAGAYAASLAPWLLFVFASSPLSRLFDLQGRQRAELAFNVALLAARAAALVAGAAWGGARGAVAGFAAVSAAAWAGHAAWALVLAGVPGRRFFDHVGAALARAALPFVLLVAARVWLPPLGVTAVYAALCGFVAVRFGRTLLLRPRA